MLIKNALQLNMRKLNKICSMVFVMKAPIGLKSLLNSAQLNLEQAKATESNSEKVVFTTVWSETRLEIH